MARLRRCRRSVLAVAHRTAPRGDPSVTRAAPAFAICAVLAEALVAGQSPPAPQARFRTTTDVVTVDVAVRSGGSSVPGLTAADFALFDNGVRQRRRL